MIRVRHALVHPMSITVAVLLRLSVSATADVPAVHLSYADGFDTVCAQQTHL